MFCVTGGCQLVFTSIFHTTGTKTAISIVIAKAIQEKVKQQ